MIHISHLQASTGPTACLVNTEIQGCLIRRTTPAACDDRRAPHCHAFQAIITT